MDGQIVFATWRQCAIPSKSNTCFLGPTRVHIPNDISIGSVVFGRPLQVRVRPMLWDRCPVCPSVKLEYCGQTVGWIRMPLVTEVGLGPADIVLDGNPAPPRKGAQQPPPHSSAHVYCGQTVAHLSNTELLLQGSRS